MELTPTSGHSASAQFVLHELAVAPDGFRAHFAFSPSLDWDHSLPRRELQASFDKRLRGRRG